MVKKRKSGIVFLLVAVACGLVAAVLTGTVLLSYTRTVDVLVVTKDIGPFERLDRSVIGVVSMPAVAVPSDAVLRLEEVDGRYPRFGLARETVIRHSHIAQWVQGGPLSAMLTHTEEPDKRAFAIPFSGIISVGGTIGREDRIDLIASLTIGEGNVKESTSKVIARNVRVLNVVSEGQGVPSIIVVVTPEQAEELVFLLENGKVYGVLNPYDSDVEAAFTHGLYTVYTFMERHRDSPEVRIIHSASDGNEQDLPGSNDTGDEGNGGRD